MIGLIQRVKYANVKVSGEIIGQIDQGILVLIGFQKDDDKKNLAKLSHKLINYRIFSDDKNQMNLSVKDIQGGLLLIPQFTLAADTSKGLRPGFSSACNPSIANELFNQFVEMVKENHLHVETGQFGADMQVELINDGPVTFALEV